MPNKNKVQFGLSKLAVAPIKAHVPGSVPTWEKPIMWPGAVSLTQDAETEEVTFWADNTRYWGAYVDNGYTGELEVARILEEIATQIYGWVVDELGGLLEVSNGQKKNFAILGQFEGDAHEGRWVIYYCAAGKPDTEMNTTEESTDPQTQSLPYTATPINVGGDIVATKYTLFDNKDVPEVHEAYQNWYESVQLPVMAQEPEPEPTEPEPTEPEA